MAASKNDQKNVAGADTTTTAPKAAPKAQPPAQEEKVTFDNEAHVLDIIRNPKIGLPVQYVGTDGNVYPGQIYSHDAATGYSTVSYANGGSTVMYIACLHMEDKRRAADHSGWQFLQ